MPVETTKISVAAAAAAEATQPFFKASQVIDFLTRGSRPEDSETQGIHLTTDLLITLMLSSLTSSEDKRRAFEQVKIGGNPVTNDADFRRVIMAEWSKNEKAKYAPLEFGELETNKNPFNIYRLVNPRVFTILQERKQKQRERTLITEDMLRNFLLIRGPFVPLSGLTGGGSLDPNVPIEMRGRGKSLYGGSAPYTLWEELNPSALASDDLEYQFETAKSILGTKLASTTRDTIDRELTELKRLEGQAKNRSTEFKTILTARANGKLDKEHTFNDGDSLTNFAQSYNALIKQLNSKSRKLGNVIRIVLESSAEAAPAGAAAAGAAGAAGAAVRVPFT